MRFISFDKNGIETVGMRAGEEVIDLSVAVPELPRTLLGLLREQKLKVAAARAATANSSARLAIGELKFLPLVPRPPKFFGFGINYPSHVGERPPTPGFFLSGPTRLVGHNEPIVVPRKSRTLDYETELAFVIGKAGKHIPAANALEHVAGYTIFNDASVRGYGTGITLTLSKGSDRTGPLGPELVTPDELPPGGDGLTLQTRRNGRVVQKDATSSMFWKVPEIIELVSSFMTVEIGDVISTGTCGGTIADLYRGKDLADESLPYLRPGEVIESEIEGIGILRNPVVAEAN